MKKLPPIQGICKFCGKPALGNYKGKAGVWKCSNLECHKVFYRKEQ